jgi:site-specific DNA-cytosine methylase
MTYRSFHLFCGMGGDALGFQDAGWTIAGAVDGDEGACRDFERLTGVAPICRDVTEMMPTDIREAADGRPHVVITSPPCKGNSSCLPAERAEEDHYQELNSLSQLGIWLTLEAWEMPPPIILLENVERITSRSREWLDDCIKMLREYGYATEETRHDCGELGGLAQHRRRYMLIARHQEQVPEFIYEPPAKRVKGVGEVFGDLPVPVPGSDAGGPMHRLPRLSPMNWLRLAAIPAGGDWRDLPEKVGVCEGYRGRYGVVPTDEPSPCIRANHEPRLAPASWADPRVSSRPGRHNGGYGVNEWTGGAHTVTAESSIQNTWASVADPKVRCAPRNTAYGVRGWRDPSLVVLGHACHDNGPFSVCDPRVSCHRREGSLGVTRWDGPSACLIGHPSIHNWPMSTADPRVDYAPRADSYGVCPWGRAAKTIRGIQKHTNGESTITDPRSIEPTHFLVDEGDTPVLYGPELDLDSYQSADPVPVISARDGTWHRPLTTLELAVLQGFPARLDGEWLELHGNARSDWRERIGNAIPPPTAEAIAETCQTTLESAEDDDFLMRAEPVWVDEPTGVQP